MAAPNNEFIFGGIRVHRTGMNDCHCRGEKMGESSLSRSRLDEMHSKTTPDPPNMEATIEFLKCTPYFLEVDAGLPNLVDLVFQPTYWR